ncbi:MAG TPA: pitrilysin family protein [Bacteroidia bacterium]|nr:pitrilysin family protein [Bacteroidia bacterium]
MKKLQTSLLLFILLNWISVGVSAQQNEIKKRPIKKQDFGVKEYVVDGIKVISKSSSKDIISVALCVRGGTANYTKDQEGIEQLTLGVLSECGSTKYPKDKFNSLLDSYGSSITSSTTEDQSSVTLNCLKNRWNESWDIFADMILNPAFDENTFNNKKEEAISQIKQTESNPDGHLNDLVYQKVFKGTRYNTIVEGSEASINKMKLDDIKKYYAGLVAKNKLYVVIVGNVSEDDIRAKISQLKGIQAGPPTAIMAEAKPDFSKSTLYKEERKLATNYIQGILNAPAPGSADWTAMKIATRILSDRLFIEIRTKRNLSYAPYAFLASNKNAYVGMYVSTTDPKASVGVMIDEIKKINTTGFTEQELKNKKEEYLTGFYMNLETNSALTGMLGTNENLSSWKEVMTVLDKVKALTVEDLNNAFRKYSGTIQWIYLGDTSLVEDNLFTQALK